MGNVCLTYTYSRSSVEGSVLRVRWHQRVRWRVTTNLPTMDPFLKTGMLGIWMSL